MTEYDFSPEAFDHYVRKQQTISKWVQKTKQGPMRDPYTPATPAVPVNDLADISAQDNIKHHRRRQSYDQHDRHRDRDYGDRAFNDHDRHNDKPRSLHHSTRPPNTKRHRSASQSATLQSVQRSYNNVPPPLPIPPQPWQMPYTQKPSQLTTPYPQYYPPKLTSPRDSKHSSRSSSTTRIHSPNSYFPPQTPPYSSPANYNHSPDTNYGYSKPVPLRDGRIPDFTNAPQYPHSAYQVKQPPTLFKRLLRGLTGGNKQGPQRVPRRKRSSSF